MKHTFLQCTVAADIWNMVLSVFGLAWAPNKSRKLMKAVFVEC